MDASATLLEKGHFRHSLFFAHLALEKLLKAHITKNTSAVPPRIHHLSRLAELAGLSVDEDKQEFLRTFGAYQIEARYPDWQMVDLDKYGAQAEWQKAKEVFEWLNQQL